jgi:hypothetical protein
MSNFDNVNNDDDGYEVGYQKPPKQSQFKPGQSGNPNGRPKGQKNASTLLREILNEKVTIQENGCKRSITKQEVAIIRLVNDAMRGDHRAQSKVMSLSIGLETLEAENQKQKQSILPKSQRDEIVSSLLSRFQQSPNEGGSDGIE